MATPEGISGQLLGEKQEHLSQSASLLWYKSLLGPAGPEGKALFFTSSSGLGIQLHFSRWLQEQTEAGPSSADPPSRPICPTQATKSLLAANIWDLGIESQFVRPWPDFTVPGKWPNWLMVTQEACVSIQQSLLE